MNDLLTLLQLLSPVDWRRKLLPASFNGATWLFKESKRSGGRRFEVSEFPEHDQAHTADLGRKNREFSLTGCVFGPGYMAQRDRLILALESPFPGLLIHPTMGIQRVQAGKYEVTEGVNELGYCVFNMEFHEAPSGFFGSVPSLASLANSAASNALAALG